MAEEQSQSREFMEDGDSIAARLSALVNGIVMQTQTAMEQLLPMISGINSSSVEVAEDVQHLREITLDRKLKLEEEKLKFQSAACGILDLLNPSGGGSSN